MAVSKAIQSLNGENLKIDMTAMIDVTFQLLIFFMCTLQFKTTEGMLDCYLPKELGVFASPPKKSPEEPVYIKLIKEEGSKETSIYFGDQKLKGANKFEILFNNVNLIISKSPGSPVVIDPDINVSFQDIISTLNICRKVQQEPHGKGLQIKFAAKALEETK